MRAARHKYPESRRLGGKLEFAAVRDKGRKEGRGPLIVRALPNELSHCRLGISIGRHCGSAVVRNRVKRLLREAFRLLQHDFPSGYDFLISVRPHQPMMLAEYQRILSAAAVKLHGQWGKV